MNRSELKLFFDHLHPVIGMVHLLPLPGSPGYGGDMASVHAAAEQDAAALVSSGAAAVMVENFGDAPFYPGRVPAITIAAMAAVLQNLVQTTRLPVGVNVLRNDGVAALSIAEATGARFIRVNVLSGAVIADQGLITAEAHDILRLRRHLSSDVKIFADVRVKHASPLGDVPLVREAEDLLQRAHADAIICTGSASGAEIEFADLIRLRNEFPDAALVAGSGVNPGNAEKIFQLADAAIVGTALKYEGKISNRIDPKKVQELLRIVKGLGD